MFERCGPGRTLTGVRHRQQRGISAGEILVVIATFMVILATVLFIRRSDPPRAHQSCVVQLHDVGVALSLYAAASDEMAPYDAVPRDSRSGFYRRQVWDLLAPYATSRAIFRCPAVTWKVDDFLGYGYPALPITFGSRIRTPIQFAPTSVVAFCWDHLSGTPYFDAPHETRLKIDDKNRFIGRFPVVHEDLSAESIDARRVTGYIYEGFGKVWHPVVLQPRGMKSAQAILRFPKDPWPPTFQSSPESFIGR